MWVFYRIRIEPLSDSNAMLSNVTCSRGDPCWLQTTGNALSAKITLLCKRMEDRQRHSRENRHYCPADAGLLRRL